MRTAMISEAVARLTDVFMYCSEDTVDQKKLKILHDNYNSRYKKMTLIEQAEVHAAFATFRDNTTVNPS